MFCTQCNDLICTKCQFSTHKDHNDENIIIDIHTYVEQACGQFDIFQEKFKKWTQFSERTLKKIKGTEFKIKIR